VILMTCTWAQKRAHLHFQIVPKRLPPKEGGDHEGLREQQKRRI